MIFTFGTSRLTRPRGPRTAAQRADGLILLGDDQFLAMEQGVDQFGQFGLSFFDGNGWHNYLLDPWSSAIHVQAIIDSGLWTTGNSLLAQLLANGRPLVFVITQLFPIFFSL